MGTERVWDDGRGGGMFRAGRWGAVAVVGEGRLGREAVDGAWMVLGSACASSSLGAVWRALRAW